MEHYNSRPPPPIVAPWRALIALGTVATVVLLMAGLHSQTIKADDCTPYAMALSTRHARRHHRQGLEERVRPIAPRIALLSAPGGVSDAASVLAEARTMRQTLIEAMCFAKTELEQREIDGTREALRSLVAALGNTTAGGAQQSAPTVRLSPAGRRLRDEPASVAAAATAKPASHADAAAAEPRGRRLRLVTPAGTSGEAIRVTRGQGVFAGADFECPNERNAHLPVAAWSRGTCLIQCEPHPRSAATPRCRAAKAVCRRRPGCATVSDPARASGLADSTQGRRALPGRWTSTSRAR